MLKKERLREKKKHFLLIDVFENVFFFFLKLNQYGIVESCQDNIK